MHSPAHLYPAVLLLVMFFHACGGPRSTLYAPGGPLSLMDFLHAYNAYALAQTYLKRGRHAEAVVEYKESLRRFTRLNETARTRLREEYGLSQEQIKRELSIAHALAQDHAEAEGNRTALERFREGVLTGFYPYGRGTVTRGEIRPGAQVSRGTWQAAQDLLPPEILETVINGDFTILVQETTDLPPSEEYIV